MTVILVILSQVQTGMKVLSQNAKILGMNEGRNLEISQLNAIRIAQEKFERSKKRRPNDVKRQFKDSQERALEEARRGRVVTPFVRHTEIPPTELEPESLPTK